MQRSIIPYPNSNDFLTEFTSIGDEQLQDKLVKEIQAEIETIILYIGGNSLLLVDHNPFQSQRDDQIENRLKIQREGRLKAESDEYQQSLENDPKRIESNQEWLIGARSREARYQEVIIYRTKRAEKIRTEMQKINDKMNIYPSENVEHKKLLGEFMHWQDCLLGLEKLANNEYGYYLWRKQEHENFLIDKIRTIWKNRGLSENKKEHRQEIKELRKELKFTQEYGYNWADDNSKRPKGL